jgi:hypothetical protein
MHTLLLLLLFLIVSNSIGVIGIFACINDVEKKLNRLLAQSDFSREDAQVLAATENVKAATDQIPHPDTKP